MSCSISVRPDYYQGTACFDSQLDCFQFLDSICSLLPIGDSWSFCDYSLFCGERFTNAFRSVRGKLFGGIRFDKETSKYKILVQIPGSYWSQLESDKYHELLNLSLSIGFNITRFDICLDDYSKRVSFDEVKQFGESGHYRLVRYYQLTESTMIRGYPPIPTCYFGKGEKLVRFYDAEVVHGISAHRWELQLRNDHARSAVNDYLVDPHCLPEFITGAVDFGIESSGYWSSFVRANWWESLRSEAGGFRKINLEPFQPCFERSLAWLYNQVAPTLAIASYGYGSQEFQQLINDLVENGYQRLKPHHHNIIKEIKKEVNYG